MQLLIEDCRYPVQLVERLAAGLDVPVVADPDGLACVSWVGYCYNAAIDDCVFFLPKVLVTEQGTIFGTGSTRPEDAVDMGDALRRGLLSRMHADFIHGLSVWVYRAINIYRRDHPSGTVTRRSEYSLHDGSTRQSDATLLDVVLSLVDFYRNNRDFLIFTVRKMHAGQGRIDWRRTVATGRAVLSPDRRNAVYMDTVRRRRTVDFDEELMVIYHSILRHIADRYGFSIGTDMRYNTIDGPAFDRWLAGYGVRRLRQIRYRYFSDKTLRLWNLCMAFFEQSARINSARKVTDYLVCRDFYHVFEAMVDRLISDPAPSAGLKRQFDGKVVDHLYAYRSLVTPGRIYYIGDSKYYKSGNTLGRESVFKQFTYARNIVQYNIDLALGNPDVVAGDDGSVDCLRYRDELTRGYDITPNFFVSADLSAGLRYDHDGLVVRPSAHRSMQYTNRLFDRDTHWLGHFNINFLYVLSVYAADNARSRNAFCSHAHRYIRSRIVEHYNTAYMFFRVDIPVADMPAFVERNFYLLHGRMLSWDDTLLVALERNHPDTPSLLSHLRSLAPLQTHILS